MTDLIDIKKVAIHGVPRSGTSWVGEILNSSPNTAYRYQPLFSFAHKDFLSDVSSKEEIEQFFHRLYCCKDKFTNQTERRKMGNFPLFKKDKITHVVYKEVRYINILSNLLRRAEDVLLCAIIRNPLSTINSWLKAPREFRADLGWSETNEWRFAFKKNLNQPEEFHGFEKWKEATNLFIELKTLFPKRVYILKYSDLLRNSTLETTKLFSFLNLPITEQTKSFLEDSENTENEDPYSVFRNKQRDDKWKMELNVDIVNQIMEDLKGTQLENYLQKEMEVVCENK